MAKNLLNLLMCAASLGNTGTPECDIQEDLLIGMSYSQSPLRFTRAETATSTAFIDAVQARLNADNPRERMYAFGPFEEMNFTGEQPTVQTFKYGRKRQVREGTIAYDFVVAGGRGLHSQYKKFSKTLPYILRHDASNVTWGTKGKDADGMPILTGTRASNFYVGNYMPANGTEGGQFMITVEFRNVADIDENFAYVKTDTDPFEEGTGLIAVEHTATSTSPTTITVTAQTSYGSDLIEGFADELAQTKAGAPATFAFQVKNADPLSPNFGNDITIVTATKTGAGWILTLAAPGTDPDNPGTGKAVTVGLSKPSVLAALPIPVIGFVTPTPVTVVLG